MVFEKITNSFPLQIAEPLLQFFPVAPPGLFDAGDSATFMVSVEHQAFSRQTSAFRFILSYHYMTLFMHFNESDSSSSILLANSVPVANFTPNATISGDQGSVPYDEDEKEAEDTLETILVLTLENDVQSSTQYEVPFDAVWHSLPYGYEGGRSYSHSGVLALSTYDLRIALSHMTSNPLTPGLNLQAQEQIVANVTVTFPEVPTSF